MVPIEKVTRENFFTGEYGKLINDMIAQHIKERENLNPTQWSQQDIDVVMMLFKENIEKENIEKSLFEDAEGLPSGLENFVDLAGSPARFEDKTWLQQEIQKRGQSQLLSELDENISILSDEDFKQKLLKKMEIQKNSPFWKALQEELTAFEANEHMVFYVSEWVKEIEDENRIRTELNEAGGQNLSLIDVDKMINECINEAQLFEGSPLKGLPQAELEVALSSHRYPKELSAKELSELQTLVNQEAVRLQGLSPPFPPKMRVRRANQLTTFLNEMCEKNRLFLNPQDKNKVLTEGVLMGQIFDRIQLTDTYSDFPFKPMIGSREIEIDKLEWGLFRTADRVYSGNNFQDNIESRIKIVEELERVFRQQNGYDSLTDLEKRSILTRAVSRSLFTDVELVDSKFLTKANFPFVPYFVSKEKSLRALQILANRIGRDERFKKSLLGNQDKIDFVHALKNILEQRPQFAELKASDKNAILTETLLVTQALTGDELNNFSRQGHFKEFNPSLIKIAQFDFKEAYDENMEKHENMKKPSFSTRIKQAFTTRFQSKELKAPDQLAQPKPASQANPGMFTGLKSYMQKREEESKHKKSQKAKEAEIKEKLAEILNEIEVGVMKGDSGVLKIYEIEMNFKKVLPKIKITPELQEAFESEEKKMPQRVSVIQEAIVKAMIEVTPTANENQDQMERALNHQTYKSAVRSKIFNKLNPPLFTRSPNKGA